MVFNAIKVSHPKQINFRVAHNGSFIMEVTRFNKENTQSVYRY